MTTNTDNDNVIDTQQAVQSIVALTRSLERSEKSNRHMKRILSVILFVFTTGITSLAITKGGIIEEVYANTGSNANNDMMQQLGPLLNDVGMLVKGMNQMMQKMAPLFDEKGEFVTGMKDAGTLVFRMKQDSDVARAKSLMRDYPNKYIQGQITAKDLNSYDASNALVVGTIAEEVKFVNESLKQMNYSISVMARNMDDTMGRMEDFMP